MLSVTEKKALVGGTTRVESLQSLPVSTDGEITALRLDGRGEDLFIGTSQGRVLRYDLRDRASPTRDGGRHGRRRRRGRRSPRSASCSATGLSWSAMRGGRVSTWQVVPPPQGGDRRLTRVYDFTPARGAGGGDQRLEAGQGLRHRGRRRTAPPQLRDLGTDPGLAAARRAGICGAVVFAPEDRRHRRAWTARGPGRSGRWTTPTRRSRSGRCSGRSGTRATRSPSTSGSPPAAPTTSRRSSA